MAEKVPTDGRQSRWAAHNQQRRAAILTAALAVIEESGPRTEVHVQQIAERAGLSRTVVYRHFADRADLDVAIQDRILSDLWAVLLDSVALEGTVPEIIERVVSAYVRWSVEHPALHLMADHDTHSAGVLDRRIDQIASQIIEMFGFVTAALSVDLGERSARLDPLVYGVVGSVFGSVRRWLSQEEKQLDAATLIEIARDSVWFVIAGHARSFGVVLDPDQRIEELLTLELDGLSG